MSSCKYPNADGGEWCWRHPIEVKPEDCKKCKGFNLIKGDKNDRQDRDITEDAGLHRA